MLVVSVVFEDHTEHIEAFQEAVLQHAKNSLTHEEPCRRFDVSVDPKNPARFFLYEQYDDEAAFAAHQQTDYFARFGSTIESWLVSKDLSVWELTSAPPAAAV